MFEDQTAAILLEGQFYFRQSSTDSHLPTRYDAEVQVRERIAPELIMEAYVTRSYLAETARSLLRRLPGDDRAVFVQDF